MKVLTLCWGNICRSPVAEAILKREYPHFCIESRGTGGQPESEKADPRSVEVCKNHGLDISDHRVRILTVQDFENFDFILAMDRFNRAEAEKILGNGHSENHKKLHLFDCTNKEIEDPYWSAFDGFEIMFQRMEDLARKWNDRF